MPGSAGSDGAASPTTAALDALGSDAWATLLGAARRAMAGRDDPELAALQGAPTSRLVAGPLRASLTGRLVDDPTLWTATVAGLGPTEDLPDDLRALVQPPEDGAGGGAAGEKEPAGPTDDGARDELGRARRRVREARDERDAWRRRAEGAEARAQRLTEQRDALEGELAATEERLRTLRGELEDAAAERRRAVDRERRRRDAEVERLEAAIGSLQQAEQRRRAEVRRREEAEVAAARQSATAEQEARRRAKEQGPPRVVPGRPSTLPAGVAPGTTEAAKALLHRGRLVLVDGYNVSLQHRGHLELEQQRTWLVQLLGTMVRQRGVRPIVVFDGQAPGGGRPTAGLRDVEVRFTGPGITADDELVLAVEGTDEPVVVVTDDRELVARVRVGGADVIGTRSLLGVVP